jgi:hypothetical protein
VRDAPLGGAGLRRPAYRLRSRRRHHTLGHQFDDDTAAGGSNGRRERRPKGILIYWLARLGPQLEKSIARHAVSRHTETGRVRETCRATRHRQVACGCRWILQPISTRSQPSERLSLLPTTIPLPRKRSGQVSCSPAKPAQRPVDSNGRRKKRRMGPCPLSSAGRIAPLMCTGMGSKSAGHRSVVWNDCPAPTPLPR